MTANDCEYVTVEYISALNVTHKRNERLGK